MPGFLTPFLESHSLPGALLAGALAAVPSGIIGAYIVMRRITYIAGGIAHCVLGGMGVAYYLNRVHGLTWLTPLWGAVAAALLAAAIIGLVSLRVRQREDTVISALWSTGMATGIVFIARTPGYYQDLMDFLFGTIILVPRRELLLLAGLDAVVVAAALLFSKQFLAVCFDEEQARLQGLRVELWYLLLLALTAVTVILLVQVVGLILTIAMLTLPVAIAGQFTRHLWRIMVGASVLCWLFVFLGLAISYQPGLPAGATIILVAAGAYLGVLATGGIRRAWRRGGPLRRGRRGA